ncbi:MAG: thiamine-phosphate kinase [Gammaproteobacteria bacterium]|nr:thiamine-phosphate kinase [Gammaproteobacteria bacterium]
MPEFDLIKRYFTRLGNNKFVQLGIGDDAAITTIPVQCELVTTVDTLVADVHFFSDTAAELIGYKALAVNLSDLAAMAATPVWFTLSIALPEIDEPWLDAFSRGLFDLASDHNMALIGGDTVRGPLTITIQACGIVEQGRALRRGGAKTGDGIFVTGTLGDARLALEFLKGERTISEMHQTTVCDKLHKPIVRVEQGLALKEFASSAIDISDGLAADLSHILECSNVGAEIMLDDIPMTKALRENIDANEIHAMALSGGDDYELCFTVPENRQAAMLARMKADSFEVYSIGTITPDKGLRCMNANNEATIVKTSGYDHFSGS